MSIKKLALAAALFAVAFSCCACGSGENSGNNGGDSGFRAEDYAELPELRLSSYYAVEENGGCKFKMKAPYTDVYSVSIPRSVGAVTAYDADGKKLNDDPVKFELDLKKDDVVYFSVRADKPNVRVSVSAQNNLSQLPFDPINAPDTGAYDVHGNADTDPLKEATLEYVKRAGGLYVYSNAPEKLTPEVLNKALTRNDVSDREVFFTFEHQSFKTDVYYGYQVRNTGTEDAYITVKNVGYQQAGDGSYYGEKEWINFYNTKFELPDMSDWTEGQKNSFDAWYGFSGNYPNLQFQAITYRIPAGQYMYVIGGTKTDSFGGFVVSDTGDRLVNSTCQNGAVLFEVSGSAEAAFYVYTDFSEIKNDTTSHLGFVYPTERCHVGVDEGMLVDNRAEWTFNDKTPAQSLPVTYTNYYKDFAEGEGEKGEPFSKIESTPHEKHGTVWYTHSNVQRYHDAVGTDMTTFHTVYNGKSVATGNDYYDVTGRTSNIGNWMKDYIDTFTFVNQGDSAREITVRLNPINSGALVVLVRDEQGKLIENTAQFALVYRASEYGDAINEEFRYVFTVEPHSVKQIHGEYNLMANSYGTVEHEVILV